MKSTVFALMLFASVVRAAPTWTFSNGNELRLDTSADPRRIVDSTGSVVYEFAVADDPGGAVLSEGRTCLLMLVCIERLSERRTDRRAFDYGYLLRIGSAASGWQVTKLLDHTAPPMNELHRNISEIGAVADDGKTALLKMGAANREIAPYTMDRVWQTWDLETPKVIGTGLKLNHGQH